MVKNCILLNVKQNTNGFFLQKDACTFHGQTQRLEASSWRGRLQEPLADTARIFKLHASI